MQTNRQINALGAVGRFSLCNCMTVYYPHTYTAHGMTLDYFNRKAIPGKRAVIPYPKLWPSGYVREYKIPSMVNTVLFSPFNEAYHVRYRFEGYSDDYAIGPHPGTAELKSFATKVPRISVEDFAEDLLEFEAKVDKIWDNPLKILVLYDHSRASNPIKKRMITYGKAARRAVAWPVIQMDDPKSPREWCHYTDVGLQTVLNKIAALEKEYKK